MKNLTLLAITLAIMFFASEFISRAVMPISPGPQIVDLDGNSKTTSYIEAGKKFIIKTPDYAAETSITKDGYRAPQAKGNPDVIFMGDSFTYGQGVADSEAFPAIYCKKRNLNCANLAVPGASTPYEVSRLVNFIKDKNWQPRMVHFFFFTGNDFSDNLDADAKRSQGLSIAPGEISLGIGEEDKNTGFVSSSIDLGLKYSNLLRIAYFKVLPLLRNNADESAAELNKALEITKAEFKKLDSLSKAYDFEYQIYTIHPEPEIRNNAYQELDTKLQTISAKPIISLAELYTRDTKDYFFRSDGHFNIAGNKKLADYLLSL